MLIEHKVTELFCIYDCLCKDLEKKLFRFEETEANRALNNPQFNINRLY